MSIFRLAQLCVLPSVLIVSGCSNDDTNEKPVASAPHPGAEVYVANCRVCHAQGLNGAPILGNTAMWSERVPRGEAVLVEHAINGFELMPANLGRNGLTEEQIGSAVSYMLSELEN